MVFTPTPRQLAASLISAIPTPPEPQSSTANPLNGVPNVKEHLLTLHVLFPNELLPALDLLDRGLVTRLRLLPHGHQALPEKDARQGTTGATAQAEHDPEGASGVPHPSNSPRTGSVDEGGNIADQYHVDVAKTPSTYYVRSAQQQQASRSTSRYRNAAYEHTTYYEVRLDAWSCSCPAFAFAAFPATMADSQDAAPFDAETEVNGTSSSSWTFGGLTLGSDMPICKHLLACVLVEHSQTFSHFVEERKVSPEEMAGWAAGWGD